MRIHVVALPHLDPVNDSAYCAYTSKVRRLPLMAAQYGHQVVLYSGPEVDDATLAACEEHVQVVSHADRERWFGGPWDDTQVFDRWDTADPCWTDMNASTIVAMAERIRPGDAVGIIAGLCQQSVADAFPNNLAVEWGIGYSGIMDRSFRAFESNVWRAHVMGTRQDDQLRWFDTTIPNAFGLDEFADPRPSDGYLLFVGRPTEAKGLPVVRELAQRYDVICAGQSDPQIPEATFVGIVRGKKKADLFAGAHAVLAPTTYLEPFGGVAVEAQLSGVPAITTDWGAFVETVHDGVTGFRCSTLDEFCRAVDKSAHLDRDLIAQAARARWSLDAVAPLYDRWLRRLELLAGDGWYGSSNQEQRL